MGFDLAEMQAEDAAWLLALSARHEIETGPLDPVKLAAMRAEAFAARVARPDLGYLITFAPDARYDSPNFKWFVARGTQFIYVDRIVVAPAARGQGIARAFYQDLFEAARDSGYEEVACEVNAIPPNPTSDAFHAATGFLPCGTAHLAGGKSVTYLTRAL